MPSDRNPLYSPTIQITLDLAKVAQIQFIAHKPIEHELLFDIWPLVQPLVERIDRRLRRNMRAVLEELRRDPSQEA
jgi:hypothetical protein